MQITSGTAVRIPILMVSTADDKTSVVGATVTVQFSKNGGAFVTASGSVVEVANGWYYVTTSLTETNTAGPLIVRATATSADEWRDVHQVI
jgi:hypothetical protein